MATVPNLLICEGGHRRGEGLFFTPLVFKDGFIELPTPPGLGVDMDDAAIEAVRDETFRLQTTGILPIFSQQIEHCN